MADQQIKYLVKCGTNYDCSDCAKLDSGGEGRIVDVPLGGYAGNAKECIDKVLRPVPSPETAVNKIHDACYGGGGCGGTECGCIHQHAHDATIFCQNPEPCKGPRRHVEPDYHQFEKNKESSYSEDWQKEPKHTSSGGRSKAKPKSKAAAPCCGSCDNFHPDGKENEACLKTGVCRVQPALKLLLETSTFRPKCSDYVVKKKPTSKEETACRGCKWVADIYELIEGGVVIRCGDKQPCQPDVWHEEDPDILDKIRTLVKCSPSNIFKPESPAEIIRYLKALKAGVSIQEIPEEPVSISQPVDAGDAAEDLQATNQVDPSLVSAGLGELASITTGDVKELTAPKPGDDHLNGDSMYDRILQLVRSGKNTYGDIAAGLGVEKRYVKTPVLKLVKAGVLEWDSFAHLKDTGITLKGQVLRILGEESGMSLYQLYARTMGDEKSIKQILDELISSGDIRMEKPDGRGCLARYYLIDKPPTTQAAQSTATATIRPSVIRVFCISCSADINSASEMIGHGLRAHVEERHGTFKRMLSDMCGAGAGYCLFCGERMPVRQLDDHMTMKHLLVDDKFAELYKDVLPAPTRRRLYELRFDEHVRTTTSWSPSTAVNEPGPELIAAIRAAGQPAVDVGYTPRSRAFLEELRTIMQQDPKNRLEGVCSRCGKRVYYPCVHIEGGDHDGEVLHHECHTALIGEQFQKKAAVNAERAHRQKKPAKDPCEICGRQVHWESKDPRKVGGGFAGPGCKLGNHMVHDACNHAFPGLARKIAEGKAEPLTTEEVELGIKAKADAEQAEREANKNKARGKVVGMCCCGLGFELKLNEKGEVWCDDCGPIYTPDPRQEPKKLCGILCTPEVSMSCWHYHPDDNQEPCDAKGPMHDHASIWGYYCNNYAPKLPAVGKDGKPTNVESKPVQKSASIDTCIDKQKPAQVIEKRNFARKSKKLTPDEEVALREKIRLINVEVVRLMEAGLYDNAHPASDCQICSHSETRNYGYSEDQQGHYCDGVKIQNIYIEPCPTPEKKDVSAYDWLLVQLKAEMDEKGRIKCNNCMHSGHCDDEVPDKFRKCKEKRYHSKLWHNDIWELYRQAMATKEQTIATESIVKLAKNAAPATTASTEKKILRTKAPRIPKLPPGQQTFDLYPVKEA